jgi:prolyl oligopeptidase
VLIQTAEGDSRVDPLHARKMAAMLQWAASTGTAGGDRPTLLFQEERAGHGVGKPVAKLADTIADGLTFVGSIVGLTP